MKPSVVSFPGNDKVAGELALDLGWARGAIAVHRFPDGEALVRIDAESADGSVALVCSLDRPDDKILPLLFAVETLRELGATRVGLVAPYLAYMRQDRRFRSGEAVSSRLFAALLASHFDWLVTLDPHLHRIRDLGEIYPIPTRVLHAAPVLAEWIALHVARPLLIGPDEESEQWVADVARRACAPYLVLEKLRRGDRDVEISSPEVERYRDLTPVLVDDIISSARTMATAVRRIVAAGLPAPVSVGVHGLFADDAQRVLEQSGAARIVTTDSVPHPSNAIEITALLAPAVAELAGATPKPVETL